RDRRRKELPRRRRRGRKVLPAESCTRDYSLAVNSPTVTDMRRVGGRTRARERATIATQVGEIAATDGIGPIEPLQARQERLRKRHELERQAVTRVDVAFDVVEISVADDGVRDAHLCNATVKERRETSALAADVLGIRAERSNESCTEAGRGRLP